MYVKIVYKHLTYTQLLCIIICEEVIHMKRRDLIKRMENAGFKFERHGGNHDIYKRGEDEERIPRHREINEALARSIIKKWEL